MVLFQVNIEFKMCQLLILMFDHWIKIVSRCRSKYIDLGSESMILAHLDPDPDPGLNKNKNLKNFK